MACPRVLLQSVSLCSKVCRSVVWTFRPGFVNHLPVTGSTTQTRTFTCTALHKQGRLFSQEHEWILLDGDKKKGTIGISDHAQDALGEVVYVDLPRVGEKFVKGDSFGVVESVKAASDLYALVDGEVTQVNDALGSSPELVNSDPLGAGWMVELEIEQPAQLDELMTEDQYNTFLAESKD